MSGRELVILLLGLAIIAVVLRGLYVAINARRGQIKLAIDKNIPQNVDLEALELAELPGGGARVVNRSLEEVNRHNSALDLAETKARSLNLADAKIDGHIPVLMDAVELSEPATARAVSTSEYRQEVEPAELARPETAFTEDSAVEVRASNEADEYPAAEYDDHIEEADEEVEEEVEEDFIPHAGQEHSIGENWEEDEAETEAGKETEEDDPEPSAQQKYMAEDEGDRGSVLFDYDEEELEEDELEEDELRSNIDTMSSIAPDYIDESELADETEGLNTESAERADDDSYEEYEEYEENEESDLDDELNQLVEVQEQELAQAQEQEEELPAAFDADSSVDEFSMTAGERIGSNPGEVDQSGLFDDIDKNQDEESDKKNRRSLFSLFGRKLKQGGQLNDDRRSVPGTADIEMAASTSDEPSDVLLEEGQVQLDIEDSEQEQSVYEETVYEEPVYEAQIVEEEIIDELDQKRSASLGQETEEQETHAEEFEHSEVLVLNVTAKGGRVFSGDDLLHILISSGLKFGDMNIFHKRLSKEQQGTVIFSVANMLNPGTFDLNNMDEFTTLGISFFLALPTAINNLDAFEQMLGVAQEIRDTLDGDLKDDHRNGMTGQTIEHYRQRVRDFELRRLKAVAARG